MAELPTIVSSEPAGPRQFFETMLRPAYGAWLVQPDQEWLAKTAVGFANDLAERLANHVQCQPSAYREHLTNNVCADFGWVRDVADNVKHMRINRGGRRVSSAAQTSFGQHGAIIVTADDGSERDLGALMANVMTMFEQLLSRHGL